MLLLKTKHGKENRHRFVYAYGCLDFCLRRRTASSKIAVYLHHFPLDAKTLQNHRADEMHRRLHLTIANGTARRVTG